MLRTLCNLFPRDWERRLPLSAWAWRVTPQPSLGDLSPYPVVTGLGTRSPFSFVPALVGRPPLGMDDYVAEMVRVCKGTPGFVWRFKQERVDFHEGQLARRNRMTKTSVGDFMLGARPQFPRQKIRPGEVSKKLPHRTYDEVYQVAYMVSDAAVVLKKLDGPEPTEFSNLVNLERCIPAHT